MNSARRFNARDLESADGVAVGHDDERDDRDLDAVWAGGSVASEARDAARHAPGCTAESSPGSARIICPSRRVQRCALIAGGHVVLFWCKHTGGEAVRAIARLVDDGEGHVARLRIWFLDR